MAVRTNPGARAPELQGWISAPNIILPVEDGLQENKEKPSETGDFRSFQVHTTFMSLPNMALPKNSGVEALEIGWKSATEIMLPAVDDIRENIQKPSGNCEFLSLKKRSLLLPNMPVGENSGGDAPEVGLPSLTSLELTVSTDSPCALSSVATLMIL
ncbi:unnamed protein product [Macrosiphum euphorbiae]|nr:unnamed protein product [Macrosiphum euphorbiae]